jgi:DNA-binding XRE family transcriptional regulator
MADARGRRASFAPSKGTDEGKKRKKLEAAGWKVGNAREFLALTPDESDFVEIKLALARRLRALREKHNWTQAELAKHVGSSQSRVAKMEAADPTVSVDLLSVPSWPQARIGGNWGGLWARRPADQVAFNVRKWCSDYGAIL